MIELTDRQYAELISACDAMNTAADRIQMTQAADLTEACRKLEEARARMIAAVKATYQ